MIGKEINNTFPVGTILSKERRRQRPFNCPFWIEHDDNLIWCLLAQETFRERGGLSLYRFPIVNNNNKTTTDYGTFKQLGESPSLVVNPQRLHRRRRQNKMEKKVCLWIHSFSSVLWWIPRIHFCRFTRAGLIRCVFNCLLELWGALETVNQCLNGSRGAEFVVSIHNLCFRCGFPFFPSLPLDCFVVVVVCSIWNSLCGFTVISWFQLAKIESSLEHTPVWFICMNMANHKLASTIMGLTGQHHSHKKLPFSIEGQGFPQNHSKD